jgi:PEP-CTERM motif
MTTSQHFRLQGWMLGLFFMLCCATLARADIVFGPPQFFTEGGQLRLSAPIIAEPGTSIVISAFQAEVFAKQGGNDLLLSPDEAIVNLPGYFPGIPSILLFPFIPFEGHQIQGPTTLLTWVFTIDASVPLPFELGANITYYDLDFNQTDLTPTTQVVVPEPSSFVLALAGFVLLAFWSVRRRGA